MAYEREAEVARVVAEEAAKLASAYQRNGVTAEDKPDDSPVTAADRACEKLIVERLSSEFPGDGMLGEEGAHRDGARGRRWIIDPIDGTKDFVRGIPFWSVLVGLEVDGEIVAGAACCPGQNLVMHACKGGGAWANGERARINDRATLDRAVLSFNGFNKPGVAELGNGLLQWVTHFWAVRGMGGAFDAMLLATGRADVWVEPSAQPWDFAALKIVVEEAGGIFRAFDGSNSIYRGNAWACVPGLASQVAPAFLPPVKPV